METRRSGRSARLVFAGNVRKLRRERGISQEVLAEYSDLHRTYVGSVERGERNISIDNMERLAIALGVKLREML
jgi:transcriptional regulator with XRE-family HTH domain